MSFIINEGEHVGLIGQNGTGKSTLLSILELTTEDITTSNDYRIGYLSRQPELMMKIRFFGSLI